MKRIPSVICLILFVLTAIPAVAQEKEKGCCSSTNAFSIYAKGGITLATGVDFQNVNPSMGVNISPEVGGGLSYEFENGIRLGGNYEFTKYRREQRLSALEPTAPKLDKPGATYEGGTAYREMWTHFNNADISFEYNFSNLMPGAKDAGVNFYLGAGVGYAFASGNKYEISMAYEEWQDPNNIKDGVAMGDSWISKSWLTATNNVHNYNALYVPVNFNLEFKITKIFTMGLRCDYKFLFSDVQVAPKGLFTAGGVLRISFM